MSAGARRHYVTIKRRTVTSQDSRGQDVFTWTKVAAVWAEIRPLTGREIAAAGQRWAEAEFRFWIEPYISGVTREMIVVWGSRTLNILSVEDPDGKRKRLTGYAKEWTS